ncbi:autophagy- protein 2 [Tilletia horrida]|uniref:Autophagy-related protein 2 n=1 Tax=Tilletia horrida TaxID=155126 RepID=A0AAN6GU26_9BASI|nr:autophagy- protein 2 [Tilletia horrida]KAK0553230.1 autophagy- protein 2 [Tilletia horrida]
MLAWLAEAVTLPLGVGTTAGIASLSTSLQRRILAYLLRRFLGHLLLNPEQHFDEASLDAALLATGRVEVRNLTLDPEAINALLLASQAADSAPATLPVRAVRGSIGRIGIQLPWPNIWSGELSVEVESLDVAIQLHRGAGASSTGTAAPSSQRADKMQRERDEEAAMAGSMMLQSVINDVAKEPEISAALQRAENTSSSTASLSSSSRPTPAFARPTASAKKPQAAVNNNSTTAGYMLQGIVDSLLARLQISVKNACINILPSSFVPSQPGRVPVCQLKFQSLSLSLAPESASPEDKGPSSAERETSKLPGNGQSSTTKANRMPGELVRSATLQGVSLWLTPSEHRQQRSKSEDIGTGELANSISSLGVESSGDTSSESSSDSGRPRTGPRGSQRFLLLPSVHLVLRQIPNMPSANTRMRAAQAPAELTMVLQTEVKVDTVRLALDRSLIVGLQLLVDDMTQWSNSLQAGKTAQGTASMSDTEDDDDCEYEQEGLSSSSSQSTDPSASATLDRFGSVSMDMTQSLVGLPPHTFEADSRIPPQLQLRGKKPKAAVAKTTLMISQAFIDARLHRKHSEHRSRHFRIAAGGLEVVAQSRPEEEKRSSIDISIDGLDLEEVAENGHSWQLLQRSPPKSLFGARDPLLKIHIVSFADPLTNYRESKISLGISDFIVSLRADPTLGEDLVAFLAAPEGAFEQVEPNEVTRISVRISSGSISIVPSGTGSSTSTHPKDDGPSSPADTKVAHGRMVLTLADVYARVKMMPRADETPIQISWKEACLLILDQVPAGGEGGTKLSQVEAGGNSAAGSRDYMRRWQTSGDGIEGFWKIQGFAPLLRIRNFASDTILRKTAKPATDVSNSEDYQSQRSALLTHALIQNITADFSAPPPRQDLDTEILRSVEEDAFDQAPTISSIPDLLEDDIPHNPSYVGTQTESPKLQEIDLSGSDFFGEGAIAAVPVEPVYDGTVVSQAEGVTIRMLHPDGIRPQMNYFTSAVAGKAGDASERDINTRIRCSRLTLSLGLFAGYDWKITRSKLEAEAKRVRRRLQKIKQLLSEGQVPDDSVEQAIEDLSESIHFTLPDGAEELTAANALEALRQEFGDDIGSEADDVTEIESTTSTWQAMPGAQARSQTARGQSTRKRTRLERSLQSLIDINFSGITANFDTYEETETLSSRLSVTAKKIEIIDNIKTSTWRTFLTELLPEGRTTHRDANAKMLRLLVENERTSSRHLGFEARVRLKVAPLRLHVDQDALDFLKAFFSFKLPGTPAGPVGPAPASDPYIQVADVHAVRIKLDYKPKRVDYGQLRQGKTIELMNFFHFDGSDMTLRHVTLRGIEGWPRFFESLNDIWTPDVKANQLADVVAGIAPIRTVVNVGAGLADLVLLPIEQYQKDGRLVKGISRGLGSFAKTATLEAVKLTAQLVTGTQVILERAEHVLGGRMSSDVRTETLGPLSGPSGLSQQSMTGESASGTPRGPGGSGTPVSSGARPIARPRMSEELIDPVARGLGEDAEEVVPLSKYARPPEDMRDALTQAYAGLRRGVNSAAQTILAVPMEVYESPSGGGAAQPVIRAVPIAFLQGALGATEAVSKTLLGLQNAIDPTKDSEGKYK